ncbi:MAG: hypothetical protein IAA97_08820 [Spirochaetes bacterium]|uniref:Uncharacterized protein n=1 Tax=Candidatus Ornithospirochaeta stercoripullorum TaxID=2840899 RepID=A0A9D9E363_9SPIO|nr:hypothetical protein [Candidatus Ornithospirochaeta stercoripullorum]
MILDRRETESIEGAFATIPLSDSAVVRCYQAGDIEIRYHRNPELAGSDVMIATPYAVSAYWNGRYIFAAAIEADDLRAIAPMAGIPLRELQEEYGVKGFYGEKKISLYGGGEKESLGEYQGSEKEEDVINFLLSLVLDSLDEIAEPVEVQKAK